MPVLDTYAAYSTDDFLRKNSSSGAVFSLLADYILCQNGIVYGVAMNSQCDGAEFIRVSDREKLSLIRGSKYLQAKLGNTFQNVKLDLQKNLMVLFTGTGCQINGLIGFLGKNYPNLVCIDVVCHGVPSPKLWRKYKKYCEEKNGGRIVDVNFRCKDVSWSKFGIKNEDDFQRCSFTSKSDDPFMQFFLRNYSLRPSCYQCKAKEVKMADITIADFWKIEQILPEMKDDLGVSMVIVRSEKGRNIFSMISDKMVINKVDYDLAIKGNKSEYCSVAMPVERNKFYIDMNNMDFSALINKYLCKSFKAKIKRKIGCIVGYRMIDILRGGK